MSVKVMSWVFEHSQSTLGDRLVLLAIADHANNEGTDAWPSIPTIAEKAKVDRATVHRAIKRLVDLGELEVRSGPGRGHRNAYTVVINKPSQSATLTTGKVASDHLKGRNLSNRASLIKEPSLTAHAPARPLVGAEAVRAFKAQQGWITPTEEIDPLALAEAKGSHRQFGDC